MGRQMEAGTRGVDPWELVSDPCARLAVPVAVPCLSTCQEFSGNTVTKPSWDREQG